MQGTKNLTKGPINRQLFNLAIPIMATSFIQMAYSLTDMAWVGRLGSEAAKEAETADMFIERVTHEIGRNRRVRVATSDGMEQIIILGHGALRVSARMFHEEVQNVEKQIRALVQGEA